MKILGKDIADQILGDVQTKVAALSATPFLAVLLVGDNPASLTYIKMKQKACARVGVDSKVYEFPSDVTHEKLSSTIASLNQDPKVHGILLQLPLPQHLNERELLEAIDPEKDVDGFHPINMGKLLLGLEDGFIPCTPLGIKTLVEKAGFSVEGKRVVVVGRSHIVGLPLAALWMQKKPGCNATVTVAHSRTPQLEKVTAQADILVAAMGRPHFIKESMVQEGAVVIDVGINKVDGRLVGDVDFDAVEKKCSAITPVPGGVGPMTVAMLIHNTYLSCSRR